MLPLGSEAAVLGLISVKPDLYWPTIVVATLGNTLGGMANWGMGLVSRRWFDPGADRRHLRALRWLERLGPKACILGWLPFIGDPLCAVAGWLRMPALPCLAYMAIGKISALLGAGGDMGLVLLIHLP